MPMLFVWFNHWLVALQTTVTFQAKPPHSASKSHPAAYLKAILWGNVVPIPFPSVLHPSSLIPHLCPVGIPHPFFSCGGLGGFLPECSLESASFLPQKL
jgi:hypothetical protein